MKQLVKEEGNLRRKSEQVSDDYKEFECIDTKPHERHSKDTSPKFGKQEQKSPLTFAIRATRPEKSGKQWPPKCLFCSEDHRSSECQYFTSVAQRKLRAIELGRCLKCLGHNHITEKCTRRITCNTCRGPHLRYICEKPKQPTMHEAQTIFDSTTAQSPETSLTNVNITSTADHANKTTFLMTASTKVFNPRTLKAINSLVFIDTGSTESYITDRLASQLELKKDEDVQLEISRFADDKAKIKLNTSQVKIGVCTNAEEPFFVKCLTVPKISQRLNKVDISNMENEHMHQEEKFTRVERRTPDILLGIESIAKTQLAYHSELKNGCTLFTTTLGPVICGKIEKHINQGIANASEAKLKDVETHIASIAIGAIPKVDVKTTEHQTLQRGVQHLCQTDLERLMHEQNKGTTEGTKEQNHVRRGTEKPGPVQKGHLRDRAQRVKIRYKDFILAKGKERGMRVHKHSPEH